MCLLLIQKNCSVFISQAGLLPVSVSYSDVSWCGFSSKIRNNLDYVLIRELPRLTRLVIYMEQTTLSKDTYYSRRKQPTSKHKWKSAMSASYCFLNCSILGNTLFSHYYHNTSPKNGKTPTQGLLLFQDEEKERAEAKCFQQHYHLQGFFMSYHKYNT